MNQRQNLRRSFRPRVEPLESRALLSTCLVDRLTDVGEGKDLVGDLRYCLAAVADGDTIAFAVEGTLNLTGPLPDLTRSINIEGPGADVLTVRRGTAAHFGLLRVQAGASVQLAGLTLANGGSVRAGALLNEGKLLVSGVVVTGTNSTSSIIENTGSLTLQNSTLSRNRAESCMKFCFPGTLINNSGTLHARQVTVTNNAGFIGNGGTLTVEASVFVANHSFILTGPPATTIISQSTMSGSLGMLNLGGTTEILQSTLSGNGIGIENEDGTTVVFQSTLSGNSAGVSSRAGTISILQSTITGNGPGAGVGIAPGAAVQVQNSVVAGNFGRKAPDVFGEIISLGHNLIGSSQGGSGYHETDLLDVDPLLGPLEDNGGPTSTHALLPGSPALDAGDPTDAPEWDQRGEGFSRIAGKNIDIGAFEDQGWRSPAPGAARPPGPSNPVGIDPGALLLLEVPTHRTFFGGEV